tara:strand:+ start:96 stop:245 length:150 start_codon:yes stop_codon:yes gene_type:complete
VAEAEAVLGVQEQEAIEVTVEVERGAIEQTPSVKHPVEILKLRQYFFRC